MSLQQTNSTCFAHLIWKGKSLGWKKNKGIPANLVRILDVAGVEYCLVSVERDPGKAEAVATRGFEYKGISWKLADAVVRAKNGFLGVFVRAEWAATTSMNGFRRFLGLCEDLKSELDLQKSQKLLGRCYAPHEVIHEAEITGDNGEVIHFRMKNGYQGRVRVHPTGYGAFTDGMLLYRKDFASMLGYSCQTGDGLRSTIWTPRGIFKGHGVVKENVSFDMVLYDGKKILKSCDGTLKFGIMNKLHAGHQVSSDFQSFNNFGRLNEFPKRVESVLTDLRDGLRDESKMRGMLEKLHARFMEQVEAGEKTMEDAWSLIYWMEQGLPICSTPVMRRKVVSMVNGTLMDVERWRVPLDESSMYRYVMSDIFAFDELGNFHRDGGILKGRDIFVPGFEFDEKYRLICGHRQPNTTPREKWFYLAKMELAYYALVGRDCPFYFVSNDCLEQSLEFMGGGDLDDQVELHTDVETVDAYVRVDEKPYPVELAPKVKAQAKRNRFDDRSFVYGEKELHGAIYRVMGKGGRSLGSDMNRIMADTNGWLNGLWETPYLSYSASNGEELIDLTVNASKGGGFDVDRSNEEFKTFAREVKRCSKAVLSRLPAAMRDRVTPVHTATDEAYDAAIALRREFLEHQLLEQWNQLAVPEALRLVDSSLFGGDAREVLSFAKAKRQEMLPAFKDEVLAEFEADAIKASDGVVQAKANARACHAAQEAVYARFANLPHLLDVWTTLMKILWVEEAAPDGPYGVSDWILGGKDTVRWTAECYKKLQAESGDLSVLIRDLSIQVTERERRKLEVSASIDVLYCSDDWQLRGFAQDSPEVVAFRSHAGETVSIRMAKKRGIERGEVLLNGEHFAWLRPGDDRFLDGRMSGKLVLAEGYPFGMLVKLDQVCSVEPVSVESDSAEVIDDEEGLQAPLPQVFAVVDGLEEKKENCKDQAEIADWQELVFDWHSFAGTTATLVYREFNGEDAVEVLNYRGEHHGWVSLRSRQGESTVADFVRRYGKDASVKAVLRNRNPYCMEAFIVDSKQGAFIQ